MKKNHQKLKLAERLDAPAKLAISQKKPMRLKYKQKCLKKLESEHYTLTEDLNKMIEGIRSELSHKDSNQSMVLTSQNERLMILKVEVEKSLQHRNFLKRELLEGNVNMTIDLENNDYGLNFQQMKEKELEMEIDKQKDYFEIVKKVEKDQDQEKLRLETEFDNCIEDKQLIMNQDDQLKKYMKCDDKQREYELQEEKYNLEVKKLKKSQLKEQELINERDMQKVNIKGVYASNDESNRANIMNKSEMDRRAINLKTLEEKCKILEASLKVGEERAQDLRNHRKSKSEELRELNEDYKEIDGKQLNLNGKLHHIEVDIKQVNRNLKKAQEDLKKLQKRKTINAEAVVEFKKLQAEMNCRNIELSGEMKGQDWITTKMLAMLADREKIDERLRQVVLKDKLKTIKQSADHCFQNAINQKFLQC